MHGKSRYRPDRARRDGLQPGAQHRREGLHASRSTTAPRPRSTSSWRPPRSRGSTARSIPKADLAEFIQTIKRPRSIIIMVKAGKPVDDMIEQLLPHLEGRRRHPRMRQLALHRHATAASTTSRPRASAISASAFRAAKRARATVPRSWSAAPRSSGSNAEPILDGDRGQVQRRALLRLSRRRRRRPLRQDHPQRHRIRRHADDRRGLRRDARRAGHEAGERPECSRSGTRVRSTPT